jgi:two-component system sensor histidine kinase BaeS
MRSLTLKLTLAFLVVGLTGTFLVAAFVGRRTEAAFDTFVIDRNQEIVLGLYADYHDEHSGWDGVERWARRERPGPDRGPLGAISQGILVDQNGIVISGARRDQIGQQLTQQELDKAVPIVIDDTVVGALLFERRPPLPSNNPEDVFIDRVRSALVFGAFGATLIALLIGVLFARTITRPIHELTEATHRVADGELGHQVRATGKDEIAELGRSFNRMSSDLARSTLLRRQMTADIAHDLRTPLSVILGYTEALSEGKLSGSEQMYGVIYGEAQQLQHLIDDLRTLSLADAGELSLNLQPTTPADMLERAAAAHQVHALEQGVSLTADVDDLPLVQVDPERMAQVLGNLISNALRYTQEGGRIVLSAVRSPNGVALLVSDDGAGIAPQDLPNIFERFYRADSSRQDNGESGLGLPIAKSIVEAHGGSIAVGSQPDVGTTFTIRLAQ